MSDWPDQRGQNWCEDVEVAALDPFRGYATALGAGLPEATVVLDAFHAVRLTQARVGDMRRRAQQETLGHRGRTADPLHQIRRLLLRGAERLTTKSCARLLAELDAGDPNGEVAAAWMACQELRHLYAAPTSSGPTVASIASTGRAPAPTFPNCIASGTPSLPGRARSSPTSPLAG